MSGRAPTIERFGLGLAALGRPGYITVDHADVLGDQRSLGAMRARTHTVLSAAYQAGIRHFDVARSYGRAEEFLADWLAAHPDVGDVTVSSKWGYRYVADWRVDATVHEVKDHSADAFTEQWETTRSLLGEHVSLYQIHSLTHDSPALADRELVARLAALRDSGVRVGLSTSGPRQAEVVRAAVAVTVGGVPLFSSVQATWNLLETSAESALADAAAQGCSVIVKEALANGRLAGAAVPRALATRAADRGVAADAVALAAALWLPFLPTVLLGAVTVEQLTSNLGAALLEPDAVDAVGVDVLDPRVYWARRAELPWH